MKKSKKNFKIGDTIYWVDYNKIVKGRILDAKKIWPNLKLRKGQYAVSYYINHRKEKTIKHEESLCSSKERVCELLKQKLKSIVDEYYNDYIDASNTLEEFYSKYDKYLNEETES